MENINRFDKAERVSNPSAESNANSVQDLDEEEEEIFLDSIGPADLASHHEVGKIFFYIYSNFVFK